MALLFAVMPDAHAWVQRRFDRIIAAHDTPGMQYQFLSAEIKEDWLLPLLADGDSEDYVRHD